MAPQLQDKETSLADIFYSWVETGSSTRIINSVEQMSNERYALLVHEDRINDVRKVLLDLISVLRDELGDKFRTLGGSVKDGIKVDDRVRQRSRLRGNLKHCLIPGLHLS